MLRSDSGVSQVDDSAEAAAFRAEIRATLAGSFAARRADSSNMLSSASYDIDVGRAFMVTLDGLGLAAPHWPVEFGGLGATPELVDVIAQELENFEVPNLYPFFVAQSPVAAALIGHGTPEQRRRWLAPIRSGEHVWCQMFSEPGAGSDLASVSTLAERDGDIWRVNGSKVWVSRATYSRWGFLLARTSRASKHGGMTTFALDMSASGLDIRPLRQMNGNANFSEVFLDNVPIPDTDRIGEIDTGWSVVMTALTSERASAGGVLGITLEDILALGAGCGASDGVLRVHIASLVTDFKIAQWTIERQRSAERLGRPGPSASVGRLGTAELSKKLAITAVRVAGPSATAWEGPADQVVQEFLTSPSVSIRGGTDEIQRNIIGERDLGLPREPKPAAS
jgi:alkylation response protein AidB-like acyl-CoA dehydrogenase